MSLVMAGNIAGDRSAALTRTTGVAGRAGPSWDPYLRTVDAALAQGEVSAAVRAWEEAHLAAVGSLSWRGLIDVGGARLRIAAAVGPSDSALPDARRAYFAALFRARQQDSLEGILGIARAFAAVGDHQIVDECVRLADFLAANDGDARARIQALVAELGTTRAAERMAG